MPKPPIPQSEAGQHTTVAAFMALLLALVTALAYASVYEPAVDVEADGLAFSLPSSWSPQPLTQQTLIGDIDRYTDQRRPSLTMGVRASSFELTGLPDGTRVEPADLLRGTLFQVITGAMFPSNGAVDTRRVDGFEVATWAGVSQQRRLPYVKPVVGLHAIAVVADGGGRFWLLMLQDRKFNVEAMQDRVRSHAALFEEVLGTLRPSDA